MDDLFEKVLADWDERRYDITITAAEKNAACYSIVFQGNFGHGEFLYFFHFNDICHLLLARAMYIFCQR